VLPAVNRLRRPAEFADALRYGRHTARRRLVVHLSEAADRHRAATQRATAQPATTPVVRLQETSVPPRVGLVVTRKIGGAVQRNLVRRRLRHLLRDRLGLLLPGDVVVVKATRATADASFTELAAELDAALATLGRPKLTAGAAHGRDIGWRRPGHWSRQPVERA
jgi:ribonuclease P protein component